MTFDLLTIIDIPGCQYSATQQSKAMTFDLSIIFDIPECQYSAAFRCKQHNVAFAFKIRNHRALRCFLDLSTQQDLRHNG